MASPIYKPHKHTPEHIRKAMQLAFDDPTPLNRVNAEKVIYEAQDATRRQFKRAVEETSSNEDTKEMKALAIATVIMGLTYVYAPLIFKNAPQPGAVIMSAAGIGAMLSSLCLIGKIITRVPGQIKNRNKYATSSQARNRKEIAGTAHAFSQLKKLNKTFASPQP